MKVSYFLGGGIPTKSEFLGNEKRGSLIWPTPHKQRSKSRASTIRDIRPGNLEISGFNFAGPTIYRKKQGTQKPSHCHVGNRGACDCVLVSIYYYGSWLKFGSKYIVLRSARGVVPGGATVDLQRWALASIV